MKIIRLLWLYKLITIISSISTNDELTCRNINNNTTRICKKKNILISVEELYPSPYLFIIDKKITSIAPNAFKNLTIFHLTFILCNDKLNIEIDSWNGLPMLKSLEIKSGIIPMIPGLFKSLDETLNKLTLIINRDDQSLITTTLKGLKNLLHLKIIKSNLTIISSDMLKFYPIVVDIEFADDNITSIELQAFSSFKSLKHLRLSSNKLKNIQPGTFDSFDKIETIDLSKNQLTKIDKNIFNNINKQYDLNLSFNKINEIENNAFIESKIRELILDNNLLDNLIPGVFKGLDELSLLSMTSNNIKKIKIGIFNELKNLTSLNLVGNNIDDIEPGSFEGLDLDCLELDNNNLTIIKSDTFRGLTSRIISLSKNNNLVIEDNAFRNSTIMILFLENTNVVVNKEAWDLSESTWINCDQLKPCCLNYTCNEQKKCQLTSEICKKQFIKCEKAAECCDELVCTDKICQSTQNTCRKINEKCFGMEYPCCENLACNENGYRCEDPHRN
ncbi:hypothetical protein HCN44_009442 [Aphidius gifuensis]|uniref:Uncharacterized protein n=1 Tax=Aphidius gifuensis TaxID=684658 RepID=A0A835CW70_APHGI|nr:hypothetical protein HCN44_009442 [Aphidius gifuensis]